MSDYRGVEIVSVYQTETMSSYDVSCNLPRPIHALLTQVNNCRDVTSGKAEIIADLALHKYDSHAPSHKQHTIIQSVLSAFSLKMEENGVRPRSLASRLPADGWSAPSLVSQPQEALSRSAEPSGQAIKPKRAQIGVACVVCQRAKAKVSHIRL